MMASRRGRPLAIDRILDEVEQQRLAELLDLAVVYLNPYRLAAIRFALAVETMDDATRLAGWTSTQLTDLQSEALKQLQRNPATNSLLNRLFESMQLTTGGVRLITSDCPKHGKLSVIERRLVGWCGGCPCIMLINRRREEAIYCTSACRQSAYRKRKRRVVVDAPGISVD